MQVSTTRFLALNGDNQFAFICPIFKSEVKALDCLSIDYRHMRGEMIPGRGGCQACMTSSMCPTRHMLVEMGAKPDAYYSAEPKVGHLSAAVISRIERVGIKESALTRFDVDSAQRAAIAAFENKEKRGAVELAQVDKVEAPKTKRAPRAAKKATLEETLIEAGRNGDIAQAITAAAAAVTKSKPEPTTVASAEAPAPAQPEIAAAPRAPRPAAPPPARTPKTTPAPAAKPAAAPPVSKGLSLLELARQMKQKEARA